jgi:hypothetical protein
MVLPCWEKEAAKDQCLIKVEPVTSPDMLAIQAQLCGMNIGDNTQPPGAEHAGAI